MDWLEFCLKNPQKNEEKSKISSNKTNEENPQENQLKSLILNEQNFPPTSKQATEKNLIRISLALVFSMLFYAIMFFC
jgi:hypothetical protein